ncbi:leukocyte immunoglobulin-like receptor subfamily B member 1 [Clarias gariepinus]|uniref:leukocyte immunoglobulin-like receptor subfamily B member 1 n=1 Tax=Clarias gariepinus TaxID=13013 RepID=UPI00234C61E1|nr:leukocyte immunoglobulin-like receptor subfamily B member 1 [Clarias gariepinus]
MFGRPPARLCKFAMMTGDGHSSVLVSLIPVTSAQGSTKAVVYINTDTHLYSGETVHFRCDIQGEEDANWKYKWYKNNKILREQKKQFNIGPVEVSSSGNYTCRGQRRGSQSSVISDPVTLTVSERTWTVLSVSPQSWLTEGDSVTLNCEVTDSYTNWTFRWYREIPDSYFVYRIFKLSDSSRGSGGSYTLSPAARNHTGVYMCRGWREEQPLHTERSNQQPLWIIGESPPVSLIINPNRTHHSINDSLSLSCENESHLSRWTVRRYTESEGVSTCLMWGSVTRSTSTCKISSLNTSYTGVYWCESKSGENSNPVNITVYVSQCA